MNLRYKLHVLPLFLVAFTLGIAATATQADTLAIGAEAPDFALKGIDDKIHTLKDFAEAEILVIIFNTNHCPTAQAYEDRMKKLAADYSGKGVALVAIQPNDPKAIRLDELGYTDLGDTFEEMKIRAKDREFNFPYLYDGDTQEVTTAYGPLVTPHVFVFDSERKLRYEGRIDNNENPAHINSHDTRNAIDALLIGESPPVETTNVFGCSVKWIRERPAAEASLARWNQEQATLNEIDAAGVAEIARNDTDKTRLVKVWATWCAPCIAEFPEVVEMHRMYRGRGRLEIISISMDTLRYKDRAHQLLNEHHASMTNYIFSGDDRDDLVSALDEEWRGPVPYTLLIAPGGEVLYRQNGPSTPREVRKAIADQIGRTYFD
ncbi:MAG: redoxin domain-containing protein [Opitutales bacterium]